MRNRTKRERHPKRKERKKGDVALTKKDSCRFVFSWFLCTLVQAVRRRTIEAFRNCIELPDHSIERDRALGARRVEDGKASGRRDEQREMVHWARVVRSGRPWRHEAAASRPMRRALSWSRRCGQRERRGGRGEAAWPPVSRATRAPGIGRRASGPAGCRRPPRPPCSPAPTAARASTATRRATATCRRPACAWARPTRRSCASSASTLSPLDLSEYPSLWDLSCLD